MPEDLSPETLDFNLRMDSLLNCHFYPIQARLVQSKQPDFTNQAESQSLKKVRTDRAPRREEDTLNAEVVLPLQAGPHLHR